MLEVDHEKLARVVIEHYRRRKKRRAIHIWGPPGIGKSWMVKAAGRIISDELKLEFSVSPEDYQGDEQKFVVITLPMSQYDPSDLKGIPANENGYTKWLIPKNLPIRGHGILFFDELNRAPDTVRSSCYSLILDGFLGDYVLPEGWIIVAAGNSIEDRVGVFDMEPTLSNRFMHYFLRKPTSEEWIDNFAVKNDVDHRIIAFLTWKKGRIYTYDPKNKSERAFATMRSWEMASDMIKDSDDVSYVSAAVGEGIGLEFETFVKMMGKYDVEKLLDGKTAFPPEKDTGERYACVSAIAEFYEGKKDRLERIMDYSMEIEPEFGMLMIMLTKQTGGDKFREQIGSVLKNRPEIGKKYGRFLF